MTVIDVYKRVTRDGLHIATDGKRITAYPVDCLTDDLRGLIRANKPALIGLLTDAHNTTAALIDAAMRACDDYGDGESARQQMRQDVEATPPHLRADLLDHFSQTYPRKEAP